MSEVLSTHRVEVVPVRLERHPNADQLSIAQIYGFSCVVRTADWLDGKLGAYIPPDSLVDTDRPEFAFLKSGDKKWARIKARKLRGVVSFGLLVPAPGGSQVGDDVAAILQVEHYEPALPTLSTGGESESPPAALACLSKYDVDALRRYNMVFPEGEQVSISEKIDGANSRFCWFDDRMWSGSRTEWKRQDPKNLWWRALEATPSVEAFCRQHPGYVLYGETYGDVQKFRYGCRKGEVRFAAFDVLRPDRQWMNAGEFRTMLEAHGVPLVPLLYTGPYSFERACELAEGPSHLEGADHVREGCVVRPAEERWDQAIGRVCLKVVGAGYLERD